MRIENIFSGIDVRGLNKINLDISYLKDKKLIELRKNYNSFTVLLNNRKKVKNIKERMTYKQIEEITNISRSTYYRIKKQLKTKDWKGMERKSTRPRRLRQSKIPEATIKEILKIRLENPTYGEKKIKKILERDNAIVLGKNTIGRMLRKLNQIGLIHLKGSKLKKKLKPNELNKTRGRDFSKSHSKKWNYEKHHISNKKNVKHNNIDKINVGELIQIDHLKINKNNLRFIEFSAIDPITRYKLSHCYSSANSKNAKDFLINKLLKQLPFKVISIQVDGGSEFRKHFEEACKELNIELFVLPPYSPKYNGRIERSNRTIREEFYNNKKLIETYNTIGDFNIGLEEAINKYNNFRPHEELDFLTPREYYLKLIGAEVFVSDVFGV
jgi:transposase